MIDGNTAALEQHLNDQDIAEKRHALYRQDAVGNLRLKFMQDSETASEYLTDEMALGGKTTEAMMHALQVGDTAEAGRLISFLLAYGQLKYVDQHLDAEIERIAGGDE